MSETIINKKNKISAEQIIEAGKEVLEIETEAIKNLIDRLDINFANAVELLYKCRGRVIITGMGKSGLIGKKLAATFSSTGTPSYFLHPAESTHGDSGILTRDDVIIAISNSGETAELLKLLPIIKRYDLKLIALTGKLKSTLSLAAEETIDVSVEREACPLGLAPTASTTATLAIGDALAVCLLKKRGFTSEDFLLFHPSGSLGKGLFWKVEDLMISGEDLPVVSENTSFKDAVIKISEKKLGMAIVVDDQQKLKGVLTDGDIRRTLLSDLPVNDLKVNQVMCLNPKTIEKTALAAKALQVMEKFAITSLIITDENGRTEGSIHIHDLLKAGVA